MDRIIHFEPHNDDRGNLIAIESGTDIPFEVKRAYYIYGVEGDVRRGVHAHKHLQQALICLHGSLRVLVDDGTTRETYLLDDPRKALLLSDMQWRELYDFSGDAIVLVLASEHYDKDSYIHVYEEFLEAARAPKPNGDQQ